MKLKDLGPLAPAEQSVIDAHKAGNWAVLGDAVPIKSTPDVMIRAEVLRYLALGGCDACPVTAKGLRVRGAWVDGVLDLEGEVCPVDLKLIECNLLAGLVIQDAELRGVYLTGSHTGVINGQRVRVRRSLHLRKGFEANALVDLSGASIDGQLSCTGGSFQNSDGPALYCNGAAIGASVFLEDGFKAIGEVNFVGATIDGQLKCSRGDFTNLNGRALAFGAATIGADVFLNGGFTAIGEVTLVRATIRGQLSCIGGNFHNSNRRALDCEAATIGADVFIWGRAKIDGAIDFTRADVAGNFTVRDAIVEGQMDLRASKVGTSLTLTNLAGSRTLVDLSDAQVGTLNDDAESWAGTERIDWTHFRYDRLDSRIPVLKRIDLLKRGEGASSVSEHDPSLSIPDPSPQPYVQLAKVYRDAGRRADAAQVLFEKEKIVREANHNIKRMNMPRHWAAEFKLARGLPGKVLDAVYGTLIGYGHKPMNAVGWAAVIIIGAWMLYAQVWAAGQFAPNDPVILTSQAWLGTYPPGWEPPFDAGQALAQRDAWLQTPAGQDYETFKPWLYAIDLFVPLDALGQENAWRPSHDRGWWGTAGYYARTPIQMLGWIMTALAAAVLTGLIGRRD